MMLHTATMRAMLKRGRLHHVMDHGAIFLLIGMSGTASGMVLVMSDLATMGAVLFMLRFAAMRMMLHMAAMLAVSAMLGVLALDHASVAGLLRFSEHERIAIGHLRLATFGMMSNLAAMLALMSLWNLIVAFGIMLTASHLKTP